MGKYQVSWYHKPSVITLCVFNKVDLRSDLKWTNLVNCSILPSQNKTFFCLFD